MPTAMIVMLILFLVVTVCNGIVLYGMEEGAGPLAGGAPGTFIART